MQNEKSGAFLPSADGSRRLRDPRAMRNDYGRLPYHLAMRKGLTWLGEMLDPSVPVRCACTVKNQNLQRMHWQGSTTCSVVHACDNYRHVIGVMMSVRHGVMVSVRHGYAVWGS